MEEMDRLVSKKKQLEERGSDIEEELEKVTIEIRELDEKRKLDKDWVKVDCQHCGGSGKEYKANRQDYDAYPCSYCEGRGYKMRKLYKKKE